MKTLKSQIQYLEQLITLFKELNSIEKDCRQLGTQGYLTEYGEGQLDIIKKIRKAM